MNDQQAALAIGHPLRVRILEALAKREASPSELAEEWKLPLGDLSYHSRKLVKLGAIQLTRTRPVRGASEHFYRAAYRISITAKPIKR